MKYKTSFYVKINNNPKNEGDEGEGEEDTDTKEYDTDRDKKRFFKLSPWTVIVKFKFYFV